MSAHDPQPRERTYRWGDPHALAQAAIGLDGLAFLQRIHTGELPGSPAVATAGIVPVDVGYGWAEFALDPQEWHYNPLGTVHGGMLSILADSALGCAVHTRLTAGTTYTSLDLTIKFARAATVEGGRLVCRGEVDSIGRRTATATARVTDASDRLIAHAVATCLLISLDA